MQRGPQDRQNPSERRDAAEHRRRILAAARDLFSAQGIDATSMHEIAQAADVGQGTLYRRFAHKGALCMALLIERSVAFQASVDAELAATADLSAIDRLLGLLDRLAAFNEENGGLLGAINDAAAGPRRDEVYTNPFYGWLRATVVGLLAQATARGEVVALDAECAADMLLAPLAIHLYLYQRHTLGLTQERIAATRRQLVDGLRRRDLAGS